MKRTKKLQFSKESLRILSKPELTIAAGGMIGTTAITCTEWQSICVDCGHPSVDVICTTGGLSCLVACDTL